MGRSKSLSLVDLMVGNVRDLLKPALKKDLDTVDANGNTPVAAAQESALVLPDRPVPSMGPTGLRVMGSCFSSSHSSMLHRLDAARGSALPERGPESGKWAASGA
jgi:hypothetical protein